MTFFNFSSHSSGRALFLVGSKRGNLKIEELNEGIRVIVAGLDMDYKGVPFKNMANLMATAEYVTKVHAICPKTGGLAQYSYRKTKSKKRILLGRGDEYMPLSREAYFKKSNKKTKKVSKKNKD